MSGKERRESLEVLLVFLGPLAFAVPLYAFGFLTEVSGNYALYTIYIACSISLTLWKGRSLADIGLTRKGLLPSTGNSVALVMTAFVTRLIVADLRTQNIVGTSIAHSLYNFLFAFLLVP